MDQVVALVGQTCGPLQEQCQEAPRGSSRSANPEEEATTALRHVASTMSRMKFEKSKRSGAQKQKQTIQAAIAAGKPITPRRQKGGRV